jgi:hypothetical protein
VKKLVISTSAEIGRSPMARSRSCSHCGDGPFFTPRIRRPAKCGAPSRVSASISTLIGQGKLPFTGATVWGFSVPRPRAARSRAMPRMPSASGRLGVIAISITGSTLAGSFSASQSVKRCTDLARGQLDDAVMLVRQLHLALGGHHAVALDAADLAHADGGVDAGHVHAGLGHDDA